ncbi:MAG: PDZ domain-containing protein, partial [Phycisphaerae bacterium]
ATAGVGEHAGVAFVIPANRALRVARQLKTGGEVARGWLGIQMGDITRDDADVLGISADSVRGVIVEGVLPNTPAAQAGLVPEDVIVRLNGAAFDGRNELRNQIADMPPGAAIELDVLRDGKPNAVRVTLGKQPDRMGAGADTIVGRSIEKLGVEALSLRPEQATRLGYDPDTRGVVVVRNADEKLLGVRSGEVIVSFNGERVASVAELTRELQKAKNDAYRLQVLAPDGERRTVILERN